MDSFTYLRFVAAMALVLGLIAAATWAAKRFGFAGKAAIGNRSGKRLSVVEVCTLDARRKLVLCRRDDKEHLILMGGQQDVVVESGIAGTAQAGAANDSADRPAGAPAPEGEPELNKFGALKLTSLTALGRKGARKA